MRVEAACALMGLSLCLRYILLIGVDVELLVLACAMLVPVIVFPGRTCSRHAALISVAIAVGVWLLPDEYAAMKVL